MPPLGISPAAWDVGVSTVVGAASVVWVKLWTGLARRDKMKPQVTNPGGARRAGPVLERYFVGREGNIHVAEFCL